MKERKAAKLISILTIVGLATLWLVFLSPPSWGGKPVDADGDGWDNRSDCNDNNPAIFPGAAEVCDDGLDNDCDNLVDADDADCAGIEVDSDGDGLLDDTEKAGFTLPPGLTLNDGTKLLSPCDGILPRDKCIKWDSPDVFIIVKRASPSNLASPPYSPTNPDPLAILRTFSNNLGVPVAPHEVMESGTTDRLIADGQHAIRVTEHLDSDLGALGDSPTGGTPNTPIPGYGDVDLNTRRIKNEVDRLCSQAYICDKDGCKWYSVNNCQNEDQSIIVAMGSDSLEPLYNEYEQNVLAHEAWHAISLAPPASAEVVLFHYNPNTGWVEEQSIGSKGTCDDRRCNTVTVTLYISKLFHVDSKTYYKLK